VLHRLDLMTKPLGFGLAAALVMIAWPEIAQAYRPFNGTDASVAARGEFELELGPLQFRRSVGRDQLLAPATVLNLGVLPRTELVVDFVGSMPLPAAAGEARYQVRETDVFLKVVLREGVLQDGSGPSVALEAGPLTPEIEGQSGLGFAANLIVSERWDWFLAHLDNQALWGRGDLTFGWQSSLIGEFRFSETAWPVVELLWQRTFSSGVSTYSALLGGIWHAAPGFDLDAAALVASSYRRAGFEARLGFTWALRIWEPAAS
jgi:hypothetical protein